MIKSWLRSLVSAGGVSIFGFLASIIIARGLGAEGRGYYASAMLAVTLAAGVSQLGLGQAFVYKCRDSQEWPAKEIYCYSIAKIIVISVLICSLFMFFFNNKTEDYILQLIVIACSAVVAVHSFVTVATQLDASLKMYGLAKLLLPFGFMVASTALWFFDCLKVETLLLAQVISGVFVCMFVIPKSLIFIKAENEEKVSHIKNKFH